MVKVSNTDATTAGEQKQHTDKVTRTKSGTFNYTDNLDCFDTEKQGFTMTPEVQTMWDQPPPAYLQLSKMTRFLHVVKHFPRHWISHNAFCAPLIVISMVPVLLGGAHASVMIETAPSFTGKYDDFETLTPTLSTGSTALQISKSWMGSTGSFLLFGAVGITFWTSKLMIPAIIRYVLPFWVVSLILGAANVLIKAGGNKDGFPMLMIFYVINIMVALCLSMYKMGNMIGGFGSLFARQGGITFGVMAILLLLYDFVVFPNIGLWGDVTKLAFASIANPILWEIPLSLARAVSRTLAYNHSSTNYFFVSIIVAAKKASGRFVMATMTDMGLITLTSIILSTAEIIATITVGARDRFVYRMCCSTSNRQTDPLAAVKHQRNKKLRIQCANAETTLEIVFIFLTLFFVGYFDVASIAPPENGKTQTFGDLALSGVIQYVCEMGVDFVGIAYLTTFAGQAYLEYSHLYHRYWVFSMGIVCFFSTTYIISNSAPYILYRIAPLEAGQACQTPTCGHEASWVYITDCVESSNSTFNGC